jgi:hypothetical protein
MTMIDVVLYSYKNKDLKNIVQSLSQSSGLISNIHLYDQHPLNRKELFEDLPQVHYNHIFWDWQRSPTIYKLKEIEASASEYFMVLSDDLVLTPGWSEAAIDFLNTVDEESILSGFGQTFFKVKDLFSLEISNHETQEFFSTKVIDPLFIFSKSSILKKIDYPKYIKYFGEAEFLSFNAFEKNIKIFSMPSKFSLDRKERCLENKYKTFSLHHGYNLMFQTISEEFWAYLGFSSCPIKMLPYNPDDVYYNPNETKFDQLDSRKFVSGVKAIY